ncbi:hypothetical protein BJ508DRAFT_381580 [Ascobolus immersus RN42]|uniref:Uncharacterized protein n=1 Tax=Ascobolus immersus RN42 TaxID=1160509 RepID=A0A3N4HJQ7_ASCIM|nr:hypothetical protein BJ508DRAFT_381580 [Ascobolus immersus RN42]
MPLNNLRKFVYVALYEDIRRCGSTGFDFGPVFKTSEEANSEAESSIKGAYGDEVADPWFEDWSTKQTGRITMDSDGCLIMLDYPDPSEIPRKDPYLIKVKVLKQEFNYTNALSEFQHHPSDSDDEEDFPIEFSLFIVEARTQETVASKTCLQAVPHGVFDNIEDAIRQADKLLSEEYDGLLDKVWRRDSNGCIGKDEKQPSCTSRAGCGCVRDHRYPKPIQDDPDYPLPLSVSVMKSFGYYRRLVELIDDDNTAASLEPNSLKRPLEDELRLVVTSSPKRHASESKKAAEIPSELGITPKFYIPIRKALTLYHLVSKKIIYGYNVDRSAYPNGIEIERTELRNKRFLSKRNALKASGNILMKFSNGYYSLAYAKSAVLGDPSLPQKWSWRDRNEWSTHFAVTLEQERHEVICRKDPWSNEGYTETVHTKFKVEDWDGTEDGYSRIFPKKGLRANGLEVD